MKVTVHRCFEVWESVDVEVETDEYGEFDEGLAWELAEESYGWVETERIFRDGEITVD